MESWRVLDFNCAVPGVTQVLNKNSCMRAQQRHGLTHTLLYSWNQPAPNSISQIVCASSSNMHVASLRSDAKMVPIQLERCGFNCTLAGSHFLRVHFHTSIFHHTHYESFEWQHCGVFLSINRKCWQPPSETWIMCSRKVALHGSKTLWLISSRACVPHMLVNQTEWQVWNIFLF